MNLQLYREENDQRGVSLFSKVLTLVESAESLEDLEK